jgi:phage terminase small subunit
MKTYTLGQLKKKLTEKERLFCHQYIIDWNGARAARVAGYSEESAKQIACENLTKPYLQQYLNFIKNNLEEEAGISKLRNLLELTKIAYSDISSLHDDWIELTKWEKIKAENPDITAAVESIDTKTEYRTIKKGGVDTDVEVKSVKVKLYSKTTAIDMINKMQGYIAPTKSDITSNGKEITPISIVFTDFNDE